MLRFLLLPHPSQISQNIWVIFGWSLAGVYYSWYKRILWLLLKNKLAMGLSRISTIFTSIVPFCFTTNVVWKAWEQNIEQWSDLLLCPWSCSNRGIHKLLPPALCVQMDFTQTFQTTTKCNNINHVWSHFYKILVVLSTIDAYEPISLTQTFVGA